MLLELAEVGSAFLSQNLLELSHYLIDPNKRIFGVYLLTAVLLSIPVYLAQVSATQPRQAGMGGFWAFLLPKRIYFHPSAKQDYALLIINKFLRALLIAPVVITMVPVALGTTEVLQALCGQRQPITANAAVIMFCFTLMLFILDDLTRFLLHMALHKIPVLWQFHKVHHSAQVLTPFTIYRSHPVENFLYASRMAIAQGLAVGTGYYLFGPTLNVFDILGANAWVFLFNVCGANLRHSHIWLSWGQSLEKWLISPAQHQIHHSDNPQHFGRNLGSALAIWDRLAGTLITASTVTSIRLGCGERQPPHQTLLAIYTQPFRDAYNCLRASARKRSEGTRPPAPKQQ